MNNFSDLGLAAPILGALTAKGYTTPTPIQAQAIPHVLGGRDLLGIAATGTGKTAAFALPILNRLAESGQKTPRGACRALILSPTRELTAQIADSVRVYGAGLGLKTTVVVGGVPSRPQAAALRQGVDVVVATPGRLLDHMEQGNLRLDAVEIFVLDEADHMLDLGFIPAIRRLVKRLPAQRQSLFFSATMPKEIRVLADELLRNPQTVSVVPAATPAERIDQQVVFAEAGQKAGLLAKLVREADKGRVLVFTRTKRGADKVVRGLGAAQLGAVAIHGNKSQGQRERALAGFRSGHTPVMVATDIAARGIDVDDVTLVVNFDLPHVPETYVHRIGRTARAGASGKAVAFCSGEERPLLRAIEKLIRGAIPQKTGAGEAWQPAMDAQPVAEKAEKNRPSRRRWSSSQRGATAAVSDLPFMQRGRQRPRPAAGQR